MNTQFIIIGTIHLGKDAAPKYADFLTDAFDTIKPDIILTEIADYETDHDRLTEIKPEYPEIILPYAKDNNINTIGILPGEDDKNNLEKAKAEVMAKIETNQWMRMIWEYASQWEDVAYGRILSMLENPESMKRLQMPEIDTIHFSAWFDSLSKYFPEYLELWNQWNGLILSNVQDVIKENKDKRILLTIGQAHKYWLSEKLIGQDGLDLFDIVSFQKK